MLSLEERLRERLGDYPRLLGNTKGNSRLATEASFVLACRSAEQAILDAKQ